MQQYDWTRFEVDFYYEAPPQRVRDAWMTSAGLRSFFIKHAEFRDAGGQLRASHELVQTNDTFRWTWDHPFSIDGVVLECNGNELLRFTFGPMQVEVCIESVPPSGTSFVRLVQWGIEDSDNGRVMGHLNCRSCWVFFMTNLKAVLEHGVDLRDRNHPDRVSCMEIGYKAAHVDRPSA